jgi:hypothetical protein
MHKWHNPLANPVTQSLTGFADLGMMSQTCFLHCGMTSIDRPGAAFVTEAGVIASYLIAQEQGLGGKGDG